MRGVLRKSLFLLCLAAVFCLATPVWKPLFNGSTFAGWHFAGDQTFWTINAADSAIAGFSSGTATPYTMVFSDSSTFDQFTIKYSYRLRAGCSGFFFRSLETTAAERVSGVQVEAKFTGGKQSEVGSLYDHPSPGWVVQHSQAYSDRIARTPSDVYQDVVVTVKRPYVYVNVNGYQAVGETEASELTAGAKAAWNYTGAPIIGNPGKFGLQIHGGQTQMDVRFRRIAILCGDSLTDSVNVPGLAKQPAVYGKTGICAGAVTGTVKPATSTLNQNFGSLSRRGDELTLDITYPGQHAFELVTLDGKALFAGTSPSAHAYHFPAPSNPGVYLAKISTKSGIAARKILIQ